MMERELPFKDQPVGPQDFEDLWEEIAYLYRKMDYYFENLDDKGERECINRLKEIKHRFFNQVIGDKD